jgi:nicotinate-nucleotide adenylyltransferase
VSKFQWQEVTAVFGGTFDPPHLGHRELVAGLFKNPGVRRVLVVPSFIAPQKPNAVESAHRVAMTKLCFSGSAKLGGEVMIDTREIDRGLKNGTPSFTFDTLSELKRDYSNLAFTLGSDQLENLHSWNHFPELLGLCHWIVLARKPDGDQKAQTLLQKWKAAGLVVLEGSQWKTSKGTTIGLFETPAREVSSRNIREKIALTSSNTELKELIQSALPPEILSYLMEQRIYGTGSGRK